MYKLFSILRRKGRKALPQMEPAAELSTHEALCAAIFDPAYYLNAYPDIAKAGVDPLHHYTQIGHREGRMPFSPQSGDAKERVSKALKYNPTDPILLEIIFYVLLHSDDLCEIETTLISYKGKISGIKSNANYIRIAEDAASSFCGKYFRLEIIDKAATVVRTLNTFQETFPDSLVIRSLIGLVRFNVSDLRGAEEILSTLRFEEIKPEIVQLCTDALTYLSEARSVNQTPYRSEELLFLDSSFPSKISSFRYGEFNEYLKHFQNSTIQIRPDPALFNYGESLTFPQQVDKYCAETGISPTRLRRFDCNNVRSPKLAYCVFLNLADYFFSDIGLPPETNLIFTLYPGGGFAPKREISDARLRRLFDNQRLRKVITTQMVTYRYLIDGGFCGPDQIEHIYGGIIPSIYTEKSDYRFKRSLDAAMNVCFVAQRYSPIGAEKGYDVFISVFKQFVNSPSINFHVVGGFDANVIPIPESSNIKFYGTQNADFFDDFYPEMDLIISPNIHASGLDPALPGSFDGFPTTAVVEAGLRGVAIFLTDFMNMNQRLDGSRIFGDNEMIIINRDPDQIAELIRTYLKDRQGLIELGLAGRNAILREFSHDAQIKPRIELIEKTLADYC